MTSESNDEAVYKTRSTEKTDRVLRWKPSRARVEQEETKVIRSLRGLINKLSVDNFKKLSEQIVSTEIKEVEDLTKLADLMFMKMVQEQEFHNVYIDLIDRLAKKTVNGEDTGTFRKAFLGRCQSEFIKHLQSKPNMDTTEDEAKFHFKVNGTIQMLGCLFTADLLPAQIMKICIRKLEMSSKEDPGRYALENLCILITTLGKQLQRCHINKEALISTLNGLKSEATAIHGMRLTFLIEDTITVLAGNNNSKTNNSKNSKKVWRSKRQRQKH